MAPLIHRVTLKEDRTCCQCHLTILAGQEAVKDRTGMYRVKPAKGKKPKQVTRIPDRSPTFQHPSCHQ